MPRSNSGGGRGSRNRPGGQSLIIGLGLIPLILAAASLYIGYAYAQGLTQVGEIREDLNQIDDILSLLKDTEISQRGYLLTNGRGYLSSFAKGAANVESRLKSLQPRLLGDSGSGGLIAKLQIAVSGKLDDLRTTVRNHELFGRETTVQVVETDRAQREMSRIQGLIQALKTSLARRLTERQQSQRILRFQFMGLFIAGIATSTLLVILAYRANRGFVLERDRREIELKVLNSELETRVSDRTAELEHRTAELEASTAELQRSNADLESFAYVASHDLQEPLRMISNFTALLSRRYLQRLDGEADEFIRITVASAQHMQHLIDDLLQYSRAGRKSLQLEMTPLNEVVQQAISQLATLVEESHATIEVEPLPALRVDRSLIGQVFQNLVSNAAKFRAPGEPAKIHITAQRPDDYEGWVISVRDHGIGFDAQYKDVIFRMFQRLNARDKYAGTGIGLAICKRIVEHHGGRLWSESAPGQGATFFFTLPDRNGRRT